VQTGNFEGMNFKEKIGPQMQESAAKAFAKKLQLKAYSTEPEGLQRLHRLAEIIDFNPKIVNPELSPAD
jgi:hypothetical protein